jgi:hypothetical protein
MKKINRLLLVLILICTAAVLLSALALIQKDYSPNIFPDSVYAFFNISLPWRFGIMGIIIAFEFLISWLYCFLK